jgi:hypothetical protein
MAATYYVATNGNNGATGSLAQPFATIQHAADVMSGGDTCLIRAGTYREAVAVSNRDNLTFAAFNGESVVLDGSGVISSGWSLHSGQIYRTTLTADVWQLFVDGEMMIPARWPNADPAVDLWQQSENTYWAEGRDPRSSSPPVDENGIMYDKPHNGIDLAASGLDLTGAIAILNVGSFKTQSRFITTHQPGTNRFTYPPVSITFKDKEHFYFVEGKLELLDAENEWFYDPVTKSLYAWLPGGGNPGARRIQGKTNAYCFTATNCDNLTISGIDFFAGTFKLDGCFRGRVEHAVLTYPSCTKRMLGILGTPETSLVVQNNGSTPSECVVYNCTFAYTDGHGIRTSGADNVIENCHFHHIDYSCSDLPSVMAALYMDGDRPVFRHNTLETFGASVGYLPGEQQVTEYNNLTDGGYKQHDGAMVQVLVAKQLNASIGWNWVHDWPRLGIRFDGSGGQGGRVHHSVGWNLNSTVYIGNHENNEILNNSGISSQARNEIVVESGGEPPVHNLNSITRNNIAPRMGGQNNSVNDIPGFFDHNWNSQETGEDIRTQLRDPENLDFRPIPGSEIIDGGVVFSNVTDGYLGAAPDIGAYEFGAADYWIPGHQSAGASMPIPPDGSLTAKGSAALIWLPGLTASSSDVYLGTDSNAVATATPASPEFRGNSTNNLHDPLGLLAQTYYWRIDAVTPSGTLTGDVWSFIPSDVTPQAPGIINTAATSISSNAATLGGELTDGGTSSRVWIHWWPTGGATNVVDMGVQMHSFSLDLLGLAGDTAYNYRCHATNTYGSSSAPGVASFVTLPGPGGDTTPPMVVSISGSAVTDDVTILFDEPLDIASATTLSNYQITNAAGSPLAVMFATLDPTETAVTLQTGNQGAGTNYFVTMTGIRDQAPAMNELNTTVSYVALGEGPDTNPPAVLSISGSEIVDRVLIVFDEPVDETSATTLGNYQITNGVGGFLSLNAASLDGPGTTVTLQTGVQSAGTEYFATLSGIMDRAPAMNSLTTTVSFVSQTPAAATIWWDQAVSDADYSPADLVYSIDGAGNLTGGGGADVFSGSAPLSNYPALLAISAWDLGGSSYPNVVEDLVTSDFVEAAVSGAGWDPTGLAQLGFRVKSGSGAGMTPGEGNTQWPASGPEFMILDFAAPAGYDLLASFNVANNSLSGYEVGDADVADGTGGDDLILTIPSGQSGSALFWNRAATGNAKRLASATITFVPVPSTQPLLSITVTNGQAVITWEPAIGTLQSAAQLPGPWTNVTTTSPHVQPASAAGQLYRVQQ